MAGTDKFENLHLDDLSLEPLPDPNLLVYAPTTAEAPVKKAFVGDIRNKKVEDRRVTTDRRMTPRFEPNRRSGKERRPRKSWDPINNT